MNTQTLQANSKKLIDELKTVCANFGLGNDGNEFKIITQVFLYKFINDKFAYETKQLRSEVAEAENWEEALKAYTEEEYEMLTLELGENIAALKPSQFIATLFNQQSEADFASKLDDTLTAIAQDNSDIFSIKSDSGAKQILFERITNYITDPSKKDDFTRAIINKLPQYDFEGFFIIEQGFDFFANLFEYLIKDYNSDAGGKYAEYYTPHAVAHIMAKILVTDPTQNVKCYDPSVGTGTLLMNLAHSIGEDKCTIYAQDISQKATSLLRLNLILNNLVHSIPNIVQGNTLSTPQHQDQQFDFIVSNPPFKLDFSEYRQNLDNQNNNQRFFAGVPKEPKKDKSKMEIYLLFIQHIMHQLKPTGKAAIVVPTGFITANAGIAKKIRQQIVEQKILAGVVSMPSNIFASTGTNVSILFLDKENKEEAIFIDASKLGKKIKEDKKQRTVLSPEEEEKIINTFRQKEIIDDFSVLASYEEITEKNYSFSAGQYFEIKIEYTDISPQEFQNKINTHQQSLEQMFKESQQLEQDILTNFEKLKFQR